MEAELRWGRERWGAAVSPDETSLTHPPLTSCSMACFPGGRGPRKCLEFLPGHQTLCPPAAVTAMYPSWHPRHPQCGRGAPSQDPDTWDPAVRDGRRPRTSPPNCCLPPALRCPEHPQCPCSHWFQELPMPRQETASVRVLQPNPHLRAVLSPPLSLS